MFSERMHDFWLRVKALVRRRELDRELDDELKFHLAMREQKLREQGVAAEEAPYAARRQFGNVTRLQRNQPRVVGIPFARNRSGRTSATACACSGSREDSPPLL